MTGGGQSSGIIVMRPTGCPEEEVSAEFYVSIQGRGGARRGSSRRASFLLLSSRVSLERRAASLAQDAVTFLCFFFPIGRGLIITPPPPTWIEMALVKRGRKRKQRGSGECEREQFSRSGRTSRAPGASRRTTGEKVSAVAAVACRRSRAARLFPVARQTGSALFSRYSPTVFGRLSANVGEWNNLRASPRVVELRRPSEATRRPAADRAGSVRTICCCFCA